MGAGIARRERAFLLQRPVAAADLAQFEPADAGVDHGAGARRINVGRELADDRLVAAHVAVDERVEDDLADRVEQGRGSRLRHGRERRVVAEPAVVLGDRNAWQRADAAVRRRVPVDVDRVQVDEIAGGVGRTAGMGLVVVVAGEDLPGRCRRRMRGITHEGGRSQGLEAVAAELRHAGETLLRARRGAIEHVGAIVGVGGDVALAFVVGADIGVVPDAAMRIVVLGRGREPVEPPAAGNRVGRLRNVDAHLGRRGAAAHFEQEPAVGQTIEQHDRIADRGAAAVAGRCERRERGRSGQLGAGLVVDREGGAAAAVDTVDDVAGADVDHRIARRNAGVAVVDADPGFRAVLRGERRPVVVPELLQLGQAVGFGQQPRGCRGIDAVRWKELALVRFLDRHSGPPGRGYRNVAQVDVDADGGDRLADLDAIRYAGFGRREGGAAATEQQRQQDAGVGAITEIHQSVLIRESFEIRAPGAGRGCGRAGGACVNHYRYPLPLRFPLSGRIQDRST